MVSTSKIEVRTCAEKEAISSNESMDVLSMATMVAPLDDSKGERASIDMVAVIDKSGSMQGEKIKLVKDTLNFLLQQLKSSDRLSIITYDTKVFTDLNLRTMDAQGKKEAENVIKYMKADNSTNMSGGLFAGLDQLLARQNSNSKANAVSSVLLFTDGQANVGLSALKDYVSGIENYNSKIQGSYTIFTFGYGKDHNEELLKGIADSGKGIYYFIETAEKIPESFADCIGGLLSVVAQNITMKIELKEGVVPLEVMTHYTNKIEGNVITITFGDLYSEETRNIIFKIRIPTLAKDDLEYQVAKVTLSYYDVLSSIPGETSDGILTISRPNIAPQVQKVPELLDMQKNRLETVSAISRAQAIADQGDLANAKTHLEDAIKKIQISDTASTGYCSNLVTELLDAQESMKSASEYHGGGRKAMVWGHQAHSQERSCGKGGYTNVQKEKMKSDYINTTK